MPAAAISVHPADAVDCEFFDLDFFQDPGLFVTCFFACLIFFGFHVLSPFEVLWHPLTMHLMVTMHCNAGAKNKTSVYIGTSRVSENNATVPCQQTVEK